MQPCRQMVVVENCDYYESENTDSVEMVTGRIERKRQITMGTREK